MKKFNFTLLIVLIATTAFSKPNFKPDADEGVMLFTSTVTALDYYEPGTTMDINFVLDFQTPDWEYGDYISLTFPEGITPEGSPTDPFAPVNEGQGVEALNGVDGQTISWGSDNNDQWGGIEIGSHYFVVTVSVDEGVVGDQIIDVMVSGSTYGTPQGDVYSTCTIQQSPSGSDLSVIIPEFEYTNYPLSQVGTLPISATVLNSGFDLTEATDLIVECEMAGYVESQAITIPLATDAEELITFSGLAPVAEGIHEIVYSANASNDEYIDNNTALVSFGVDSVYAHDDGGIGFSYGSVAFPFRFGSVFDIIAEDELTAVQIYISENAAIGVEYSVSVHPVTIDGSNVDLSDAVWQSDDLFVTEEMRDAWTTVSLDMAEMLEVGTYAVMSNEHVSASLELGFDGNPLGDMIFEHPNGIEYLQDETYGYPMLRMVFGEVDINTGVNDIDEVDFSLYPNPTNDIVNVTNVQGQNIEVYTMYGKKIAEINNASSVETVDLSEYAAGTYLIKVGASVQKVNKIK